jgi:hypothetical protein
MRKHHKRTVQLAGVSLDAKLPLSLMTKGRDLSYAKDRGRGKRHGSRGNMSDMISMLYKSVSINAKGGDC